MKPRTEGEQKAFIDGYAQAVLSMRNGSIEQSMLWVVESANKLRHNTAAIVRLKRELGQAEIDG